MKNKKHICTNIQEFLLENIGINNVLVVVDVQKRWINKKFINKVFEYSKQFKEVYQLYFGDEYGIYDESSDYNPDVTFPNEIAAYEKGLNFYDYAIDKIIWANDIEEKLIEDEFEIGSILKLPDDSKFSGLFMVKISHQHWFLITESIKDLYDKLKDKNIILVGGGVGECLDEIYISMKAFNLNVTINNKYTYSNL